MTSILGISAFYHDSAAALVRDGDIVAAVQEERLTRKKFDASFPENGIKYCLTYSSLRAKDLDYVAFYDKPFIKFDRLLKTYLAYAPRGIRSFMKALPAWVGEKLWIREIIQKKLDYIGNIIFLEHHESHAASAFFPSPFREAAFLTIDGVGEWTTASFGIGRDNKIQIWSELHFPHSLGLLYSAFTYYTGFKVNSDEYKVMGLAPYGEPRYKDLILSELVNLREDGSFKLNMKYFNYCTGLIMVNKKFEKLFGWPPRKTGSKIEQRDMDLARSIQEATEEILLCMVRHVHKKTNQKNLCLAGGVALNCVANGRILRQGPFENIWIQPAASDAGGALGAALFVWYQYLGNVRKINEKKDSQHGSYLGPQFDNNYIMRLLNENKVRYTFIRNEEIPEKMSDLINDQRVVGWFQGRMEFGPRALGNRSILGDARSPYMQEILNLKIKFRESFRPFAASALREKVADYFKIDRESPYMLLVAYIKDEITNIPAVTHVDYSTRLQTVNKDDNPLYYNMILKFYEKYDCAVIINTSFNVNGEPIVSTPEEAYQCFMRTDMDYLMLGNFLINKEEQKLLDDDMDWLKKFESGQ